MKKILAALLITGTLALFLLLAVSSLIHQLVPASFDPVAYHAEQLAMDRADAIAPAQTAAAFVLALFPALLAVVCLLLLAAGGSVAVWRFFRERRPNSAGLLPVNAQILDDVAPRALAGFHAARLADAQRALVPNSLNYSPHIAPRLDYRGESGGTALPAPDEPAAESQLPGVVDLAALPFTPSTDAILLGVAEGNELVTVPMRSLWHIGTAGPTGAGKSNIARLILPQLLTLGAQVAIIDPKFTPFDAESGEDWRPIADRLFIAPARRPDDIASTIGYFHDELERRLDMRNAGKKVGGPLFLYCDEYTTITEDVKNADERIARLARLGRGVNIFLLIAAHDLLVKSGAGDTRDQLRTGFYLGGDSKTGSVLLDMPQREVIQRESDLTLGVGLLRSAATSPARLVRIPYASNQGIARILGASQGTSEGRRIGFRVPPREARVEVGSEVGLEAPFEGPLPERPNAQKWTPEELRIVNLLAEGKKPREIVIAVFGIEGGREYQRAAGIVAAVIARLARGERP